MKPRRQRHFEELSTAQRIKLAKAKTDKLIDHLMHLLSLQANNAIVIYSPALSSQIPKSYAAHAFRDFQHALHRYEIVRLCAIWDSADSDKENIATVVALIDDPKVIESLCAETESHWAGFEGALLNPSGNAVMAEIERHMLRESEAEFGRQQAEKARAALNKAIADARAILASDKLASVMNLRDKRLAHSLEATRREKSGAVAPMKYGYEKDLLESAIAISEALYCWVNGVSFDFENSRRIYKEYSEALWSGCTFNVKK